MRARDDQEQVDRWERLALASGVLYGLAQSASMAFSLGVIVPRHAPIDAPAEETARALGRDSKLIAAGTYLFTVPLPFLLVFLGGLFGVLRRGERGSESLAGIALVAGVASGVIGTLGAVLSGLSAPIARQGGDPVVVKELDSITPLAMSLAGFPQAVLVAVVSAAVFQNHLAPRWVAWTGAALSGLSLVSTATIAVRRLFPATLLTMLLFPLWMLALAVALLRGTRPAK